MTQWTNEGLWNAIVGAADPRASAREAGVSVEAWLTAALRQARDQGLDDLRSDEEILAELERQVRALEARKPYDHWIGYKPDGRLYGPADAMAGRGMVFGSRKEAIAFAREEGIAEMEHWVGSTRVDADTWRDTHCYCVGCGDEIAEPVWHGGVPYCRGCDEAPAEEE